MGWRAMKVKPEGVAPAPIGPACGAPLDPFPEGAASVRGCAVFCGVDFAAFDAGAAAGFLSFEMRTWIGTASGSGRVKPQAVGPCRPTAPGGERHAVAPSSDCEIAHTIAAPGRSRTADFSS